MNLYLRKCKRCKRGYDIGINYDICPVCREIERNKKEGKDGDRRAR